MSFARTEDGFVVYKLYMGNIPKNFTKGILQTHFSRYGEVSVEIGFSAYKIKRYAFINFKNPDSATRALTTKRHHITVGTRDVSKVVKAAYSWFQPNEDKLEIESDSLIMMLNDDCLIHIFSFLSTPERIKLSYMNERFKQLFKITNIHKKSVSLSNLTLIEIRFICREFGQLIQEINLECLRDTNQFKCRLGFDKYIAKYCCELRSLNCKNLRMFEITNYEFMKNLTKISLRNCDITDDTCFHLSKLQNLNHLDVSENGELSGEYLKDFPELTHLNLWSCVDIRQSHMFEFCSSERIIENLKSLNLKSPYLIRPQICVQLAFLKNLESLVITSIDFGLLSDIKKLKNLIIYLETTSSANQQLTEKCLTNLETLLIVTKPPKMDMNLEMDINFIFLMKNLKKLGLIRCYDLKDGHMAKIAAMPELKYLDITGCTKITFNGFLELFKKPNKLQHINISETGFYHIFLPFSRQSALEDVRKKMVETGRKTHFTLYFNGENENRILELLPWLTIVKGKFVFPGMKLREEYCYEFED